MTRWCAVALSALGVLTAQDPARDPAAALARATLIEEQEGDLNQAEQAYRALLADQGAAAVQVEASLRLGALLWRLDRHDDAKPFLDRAVQAGGEVAAKAQAVLQGQGDAERLERARAMVRRINTLAYSKHWEEGTYDQQTTEALAINENGLDWLGDAAVQAILEDLDSSTGHGNETWSSDLTNPAEARLLRKLWQIGTPRAKAWLEQQVAQEPVQWLRFLARGSASCAASLHPTKIAFLKVKDPTSEVWAAAVNGVGRFPLEDLVAMANDADVGVRCAAFEALRGRDQGLQPSGVLESLPAIETSLRATLREPDPRSRYAWRLVSQLVARGGAGRKLYLSVAAESPPGNAAPEIGSDSLDDRDLQLMVAAARQLAPDAIERSSQGASSTMLRMLLILTPAWTADGVRSWLELVDLGYAQPNLFPCAKRSAQVARDDDVPALVRTLPKVWWNGLEELRWDKRTLREDALPALTEVLGITVAECEQNGTLAKYPEYRLKNNGATPSVQIDQLLGIIAGIGTDAAADALRAAAAKWPVLTAGIANWAICMSQRHGSQPARALLRELLVRESRAPEDLHPFERTQVLAELVRAGDVPTIALLPQAFACGLATTTTVEFRSDKAGTNQQSDGLGLFVHSAASNWCGYQPNDLAAAWQQIVDHYPTGTLLGDLIGSLDDGNRPGSRPNRNDGRPQVFRAGQFSTQHLPLEALAVLTDVISTQWSTLSGKQQQQGFASLFTSFGDLPTADNALTAAQRTMLDRLLTATDGDLSLCVLELLPQEIAARYAQQALAALGRAAAKGRFQALRRQGIALDLPSWRMLLGDRDYQVRAEAMRAMPKDLAADLRPDLEARLTDPNTDNRSRACAMMRQFYGTDAVAALLTMLHDDDEAVRKTAEAQLDSLRQEQEQRAFWANARTGIDTSPAGAAAKLLAQAQPDQPKEQRVLAITSLGVLGEPTALPYLIDATRDADAEIAAAAKQAITTIQLHGRTAPK